MQCCEALEERNSWAHNLFIESTFTDQQWLEENVGAGALRYSTNEASRRFQHYGAKLTLYSYRSMTRDEDALNAFTGVLQRLEAYMYKTGFFVGLPLTDTARLQPRLPLLSLSNILRSLSISQSCDKPGLLDMYESNDSQQDEQPGEL